MNNKDIMLCLRRLKDEGIKFKYIAEKCEIPINQFYKFTSNRTFPLIERQKVEDYLFSNFEDIVVEECISSYRRK